MSKLRNLVGGRRVGGFTIIELLVVVIVIGILASAGIAKYQNFSDMARKRTCSLNQNGIETAIAVYNTQNVDFQDNAEGFGRFSVQNSGWYHGGWGTGGPFNNTWGVANVVRDKKMFICPSAMKAYNDTFQNIPNDIGSYGCNGGSNAYSQYYLYWGGPGYGAWNGHYWYDHGGGATRHMVVWCGMNGSYNCNGPDNTLGTRHSAKW